MAGVTILSEQVVYNTLVPEWVGIIACVGLFVLWFISFILIATDLNKSLTVCMIGILILSTVVICSLIDNKKSINHIEYKVAIDDSVSMNEFLDRYEILDQEGKIYIIREKE